MFKSLSLLYQQQLKLEKMKTSNELTVTTTWHNIKRAFYSVQLFAMTLAIPALFYVGLTHDVQAERNVEKNAKQEQVMTAKTAENTNSTNL